jgi:hypothetical protein
MRYFKVKARILLLKLIPYEALFPQIETEKIPSVIGFIARILSHHHSAMLGE